VLSSERNCPPSFATVAREGVVPACHTGWLGVTLEAIRGHGASHLK
jgi:hypothetical protein